MSSLAYALGQAPLEEIHVSDELARKILKQSSRCSTASIAKACKCSTKAVRAVVWEERYWRERLGIPFEEPPKRDTNRFKSNSWTIKKKAEAIAIALTTTYAEASRISGVPRKTISSWIPDINEERGRAVINLRILRNEYPDLKALLKSKKGRNIQEWERENGMKYAYFILLRSEYEG